MRDNANTPYITRRKWCWQTRSPGIYTEDAGISNTPTVTLTGINALKDALADGPCSADSIFCTVLPEAGSDQALDEKLVGEHVRFNGWRSSVCFATTKQIAKSICGLIGFFNDLVCSLRESRSGKLQQGL